MIYENLKPVLDGYTAQKMKFSITNLFSKCDQIRRIIFTEEILNGKLHFLCSIFDNLKPFFINENKLSVILNLKCV